MSLEVTPSLRALHRPVSPAWAAWASLLTVVFAFVTGGCSQTFDAGYDRPHGLLPVDERNPIILLNDGAYDNWSGEYAVLLANAGGSPLAGIIVNETSDWPDIDTNFGGYRDLVAAARASGLKDLPDPIASIGPPLVMPATGKIDDTQPNRSNGALTIVNTSKTLGLPYRPLVIATGGALTDVADAYLVDHTVTERVVIVSSLGSTSSTGGGMGVPNGQGDPWADVIVSSNFRYVQVSAWYDQLTDVPARACPSSPTTRSAPGSPPSSPTSGSGRLRRIRSRSWRSVSRPSRQPSNVCLRAGPSTLARPGTPAPRRGPISRRLQAAPTGWSPGATERRRRRSSGRSCSARTDDGRSRLSADADQPGGARRLSLRRRARDLAMSDHLVRHVDVHADVRGEAGYAPVADLLQGRRLRAGHDRHTERGDQKNAPESWTSGHRGNLRMNLSRRRRICSSLLGPQSTNQ